MSVEIIVKPAGFEHVEDFARAPREADVQELKAASGATPRQALLYGVRFSTVAWAAYVEDEPLCMLGVAPQSVLLGVGTPWCIGTALLERHQFAFLRRNREYVGKMLDRYEHLVNYVDDRHRLAKRWIKWLGFRLGPPVPYGAAGLPFRRFELHASRTQYQERVHV